MTHPQPTCPIACELQGIIDRDDMKRADEITPHVWHCPECQAENERIAAAHRPHWGWRLAKGIGIAAVLIGLAVMNLLVNDGSGQRPRE